MTEQNAVYVVVEVGCLECGYDSLLAGVFSTREALDDTDPSTAIAAYLFEGTVDEPAFEGKSIRQWRQGQNR